MWNWTNGIVNEPRYPGQPSGHEMILKNYSWLKHPGHVVGEYVLPSAAVTEGDWSVLICTWEPTSLAAERVH